MAALQLDSLDTEEVAFNSKPGLRVKVAAVQAEPIYFDLKGAVEKAINIIAEAAEKGAQLVAFLEVWIPSYPAWIWARGCDIDLVQRYIQSSFRIESEEMARICAAAARTRIAVVLGYSERDGSSGYIGQCCIGSDREIQRTRRKIKPTHMERTVFGEGGGESLINVVDDDDIGRIHVAAWPAQLPHEEGKGLWSTANEGSLNLSVTRAIEGGCFVLHACSILTQRGVDVMKTRDADQYYAPGGGGSCVIRPDGKIITERIPDDEEGLIVADLDFGDILRSKVYLDTQGHYSRPDLLWLGVDTNPKPRVRQYEK